MAFGLTVNYIHISVYVCMAEMFVCFYAWMIYFQLKDDSQPVRMCYEFSTFKTPVCLIVNIFYRETNNCLNKKGKI